MYKTIYVPLDNSDHSNVSAELALSLSKQLGGRFVGSHAYAAALHDVRFKQMEFTLPDEYKDETELEKQRRIHDSLIARGLTLISDSYLDVWKKKADEMGVPFEGKRFDGRNFQVIVEDIEGSDYDLVILGALGQGAVRDSEVGSVCERVLRRTAIDTLVVRDLESASSSHGADRNTITVCLDGSAHSWAGLRTACGLAQTYGKHLEIVVAVEHGAADSSAAPANLMDEARRHAREYGITVSATMLDGHPRQAILDHLARTRPWLVVVGRTGADADDSAAELGSLVERLVRRAPCNVLLTNTTPRPRRADAVSAAS